MVHTPVHASWLSQVEIFFSIIQKKVVSRPFSWKYTADDLRDLLRRISEHEEQEARQQQEQALHLAA